ncbi:MAG TPA: PAS domain S-box protein, partial [Blastocatellia bacterium]|nr:PAS domain S-box protein [Blastocatellia bacterium]
MNDGNKTKAQLISELEELRRHVAELETAATDQTGIASFLTMAEAAASAIFVFRDSVFLYANPATAKLTGYTVEELIGRNIWTLVHPEFLDRNEQVLAFQRGEAVSPKSEFKIVTKGGETRWLNADATITEFGGSPAVLTIAYDCTEYKVAQEALRISEDRYQNIMETAQEAIWVVDPRAITTYVNQRLAEMLGYPPEEILGHSVLEFVDPAERQETLHHLERGRQGFRERLDHRFRCRDGSYVWAIVSTTPLFDSAGEFIGGLAMLIDITERKRTERALKENEALLKAAIENLPFELWARETAGRCIIQNPYSVLQWGDQIGNTLEQMSPDHAIQERCLGYQQRAL